jgi:hypothetical protein
MKPIKVLHAQVNVKWLSAKIVAFIVVASWFLNNARNRNHLFDFRSDDVESYIWFMLIFQLIVLIFNFFFDVRRIELYENDEIHLVTTIRKIIIKGENDFFRLPTKKTKIETCRNLQVYKNKMRKFTLGVDSFSDEDQQYIRENFPIRPWSGRIHY